LVTILRNLWKNEVFKTIISLALVPIIIVSCGVGLPKILNTDIFPLFVVISGSMCISEEQCNTFSHAFDRTLHVGDLLVIQGVDAKNLKTDYPNSDIIVFRNPNKEPNDIGANIVHRIIDVGEVDGKLYFHTKGDGNGGKENFWPQEPKNSIDPWYTSEDYVYGKVVMRVPWVGSLAMQSQKHNAIPIILVIAIILVVTYGFVLPLIKKKPVQHSEPTLISREE
jgi:signal peptidase I